MKILLDKCITKKLKAFLLEFNVFTVRELNISGIKNGKLLTYCVDNNFDILLTIDKNLMFQQNLDKYPLSIVVINCFTSKIEEIGEFIPSFKKQCKDFVKHKAYIINR